MKHFAHSIWKVSCHFPGASLLRPADMFHDEDELIFVFAFIGGKLPVQLMCKDALVIGLSNDIFSLLADFDLMIFT